jgi:hypothetical protein
MQKSPTAKAVGLFWQGHKDLNPEPTVLEAENGKGKVLDLQGFFAFFPLLPQNLPQFL